MAVRKSIATGNFTTAGTWGLVDSTSYSNSETAIETLTTAYSGTRSATFTPGAITVEGIAVKYATRGGTVGTTSVSLYNNTAAADVAGTEVTIDTADFPSGCTQSAADGGWIYFKFASPVLLLAATAYRVQAKASSSSVSLFRDSTADNISRALITTTTGAPAAGDDLIVAGEYTGQGTSNTITVTMDNTATTDFGAGSTSSVTPALAVCSKGVLTWGVTAATAYYLKISGRAIVYRDSTLNIGTSGSPIPRGSTAEILFDCVSNVDFGFLIRNGTFVAQGLSRTSGKNIVQCLLNTDEAVNSTSLGVDTDTGWLDNDVIAVASTSRTIGECEKGTLNGNAGASSLTVDGFAGAGGGLAFAHLGTAPIQAEVILLTRNIFIHGASASAQAFINITAESTIDWDWAEFYWMGSATTGTRGIESAITSLGSMSVNFCSIHDFGVTSSRGLHFTGSTRSITVEDTVTWNIQSEHMMFSATSGADTYNNITSILSANASANIQALQFLDVGSSITNIRMAGCAIGNTRNQGGILVSETTSVVGTINNLIAHSCGSTGVELIGIVSGTITNIVGYRNGNDGLTLSQIGSDVVIDTVTAFGNVSANIGVRLNTNGVSLANSPQLNNLTLDAGSTLTCPIGISCFNSYGALRINNSSFGATTTHSTGDIAGTSFVDIVCHNVLFASSTEVSTQTTIADSRGSIGSSKHDQTDGLHKMWKKYGTITIDTTIYDAVQSVRLTPNNASNKLEAILFRAAVADTGTATVSVKVRESVVGDGTDYNGNRIRLIVKKNVAAGITADTVLDTATISSEGSWETLSGTTAAVTDDAILEFAIDCDGTTGWVNVDTWVGPTATSTLGMKYWRDGLAYAYADNSTGGGGTTAYTFVG